MSDERLSNNLLITGVSGFLGAKFRERTPNWFSVHGTYCNNNSEGVRLDITEFRSVNELFEQLQPVVVIHAAAYSNCDLCEQFPERAWEINVNGTRNIAQACKAFGSTLIYISSSYIFDGIHGMYSETVRPCPINQLGRTKVAGEDQVLQSCSDAIIVRFSIAYGYNGPNCNNGFFDRILDGKCITVNDSDIRQPPLVDDVADAVFFLVDRGQRGIFHLGGPNTMSTYEMAKHLESIVRKTTLLTPSQARNRIAPRPRDVTLDCSKIRRLGMVFKSMDQGLITVRKQLQERTSCLGISK